MKSNRNTHRLSKYCFKPKSSLIVLFVLITFTNSFAQDNTMYYIDGIPDVTYLNPAKQPYCNIYFATPLLTHSNAFYNSAFTLEDIIYNSDESDIPVLMVSSEGDLDKFLNLFEESNNFSIDTKSNLISGGFRINRTYFTLNITYNQNFRFYYPDDFVNLIFTGNQNNTTYDFTSFGVDTKSYIEYGIGISRKILDNLTIGIRPKLYQGIYAIQSDFEDVSLYTSYEEWRVTAKGDINVALPLVDLPENDEGEFDINDSTNSDYFSDELERIFSDPSSLISSSFANKGFGIDIGIVYTLFQKAELSASIVDLGYINWQEHTRSFSIDGQFTQGPVDIDGISDNDSLFDGILDSISSQMQIEQSTPSFRTSTEPSLYLGGRYYISENFDAGLLFHAKFYEDYTRKDLTLSTNFRPSNMLNISFSYSLLDGKYLNFGFGTSLRFGPLLIYTVIDDYSLNRYEFAMEDWFFNPSISRDLYSFNYRFGITWVLGCNKKKQLKKDRPLLYSDEAFIY